MRFLVEGDWTEDDEKPCDGAIRETYLRRDARATPYASDIPGWMDSGTNHRIEDVRRGERHIVRDVADVGWFIELATTEDLVRLCLKHPISAVCKSDSVNGEPRLILDARLE